MTTTTPRIRLGDVLRVARKSADLDQENIATALNVSRPTVSKWENSKSHPPFWAVVEWAQLTGVDLEFFVSVRPSDQGNRSTIWSDGADEAAAIRAMLAELADGDPLAAAA